MRSLLAARWLDPAFAALLGCACLIELLLGPGMASLPRAAGAAVLVCAPVAVARRHPLGAACAAAAIVLWSYGVSPDLPGLAGLPVLVLAYSCGAHAAGRSGVLGVGILLLALQVGVGIPRDEFVPIFLGTLGPFWAGRQVRLRRDLVGALVERARELEAEEDAFARLAVRRERARIARELHDIVAHHLAVMVVQAGAGRLAAPGQSDAAAQRFATISESGDHALTETARLVDVVHAGDGDGGWMGHELRVLLDEADAVGLKVSMTPLPSGVDLPARVEDSAYRIVREGLTNAMKHAPGAEVHVRLAVNDGELEIELRDGGGRAASGLANTGSSLGLTGMRERIESLGGRLHAGPEPDGGWCLRAQVPRASSLDQPRSEAAAEAPPWAITARSLASDAR